MLVLYFYLIRTYNGHAKETRREIARLPINKSVVGNESRARGAVNYNL